MKTGAGPAFPWSGILILFISSVIPDGCDVDEEGDSEVASIEEESSGVAETDRLDIIVCSKRLTAVRRASLSMVHFAGHDRAVGFAE